ncbi:MAG: hypothetical protein M1823_001219 [Watsoniomyces obsoletus]|nr:MAG: hypothetical protein M1823_001219 [Watsoniomyces obsoletus]
MGKSVLLCFIHGFSGDDDTFRVFPTHLRDATQKALPDWHVVSAVYPKYETKGDLPSCVSRFREWLQNRVDELESKESGEDELRVVLVAHSMGGFVAADAILSIVDEHAAEENKDKGKGTHLPQIQGLLTFDTPFMGIASPMLAYSAFSNFAKVSSAYRLMSLLPASFLGNRAANASGGGGGNVSSSSSSAPGAARRRTALELGAIPAWRTIAAYTGTTGALAAAGVAAYMNREELYQGYTWIQNHLQFVGVIMKRGESRMKLARITALEGFGFGNLYTSLGQNPAMVGGAYIPERTFCAIPPAKNPLSDKFRRELNLVAKDEIDAHTSMFKEDKNPGYHRLLDDAKDCVIEWINREFRGYRIRDLEKKTNEAMDGSAEDEEAARLAEEALMAASIPLPVDGEEEGEEEMEGGIYNVDLAASIPLPNVQGEEKGLDVDIDPSKEEVEKKNEDEVGTKKADDNDVASR